MLRAGAAQVRPRGPRSPLLNLPQAAPNDTERRVRNNPTQAKEGLNGHPRLLLLMKKVLSFLPQLAAGKSAAQDEVFGAESCHPRGI
jgi:hypothetical protein